MSHLGDLESWTRHAWFRRGVIEGIGRYVEGRDGAVGTRDPRGVRTMQNSTVNRRQRSCRITLPPPTETGIPMRQSDGFGQKYFQCQNERKCQGAESCVWGVDNIKTEKRKIRVQSKNKKRKRAGQRKVHSRQEMVVYFPKSVNESTNRG